MLANDYYRVIAQVSKFDHSQLLGIITDAHRICAISNSSLDDYENAFEQYLASLNLKSVRKLRSS